MNSANQANQAKRIHVTQLGIPKLVRVNIVSRG